MMLGFLLSCWTNGICKKTGAMTTSEIKEAGTDIIGIVIEFIDGVFHQGLSVLDSVVGLPVASDKPFVAGEEVSEEQGIEHIF